MTQLKNQKKEKKMRKTLIATLTLAFIVLLVPYGMFARVFGNGSGCFFAQGCNTVGNNQSSGLFYTFSNEQNLNQLIAEGAGFFISSQSDYSAFLNKVEMADLNDVNYQGLRECLLLSSEDIEKAIVTYADIIATTDTMPNNPDMVKKLQSFDYAAFQNKKCLNGNIFELVSSYLKKADVRGLYTTIHKEMESISTQLIVLETMVNNNQFPGIEIIWQLNQKYAELMLFGQYIAEVFYEIN